MPNMFKSKIKKAFFEKNTTGVLLTPEKAKEKMELAKKLQKTLVKFDKDFIKITGG